MVAATVQTASLVSPVQDPYGRATTDLRISVTKRCNLACFYCHNEGQDLAATDINAAEIATVVRAATACGVTAVKLTGGEPLIRKDIVEIVAAVAPLVPEVSMTTNGVLLPRYARGLADAGLRRLNLSLDTPEAVRFQGVTGHDLMDQVLAGIAAAKAAGLQRLKVNMVVMRDVNHDQIEEMLAFCARHEVLLQLIEIHTDRHGLSTDLYQRYFYDLGPLEDRFARRAIEMRERAFHRRKVYTLPAPGGGRVDVEVVRPMHNPTFCGACTRIRLTADGLLKPCLFVDHGLVDVLGPIHNGASDAQVRALVEQLIASRVPYWMPHNIPAADDPASSLRVLSPIATATAAQERP